MLGSIVAHLLLLKRRFKTQALDLVVIPEIVDNCDVRHELTSFPPHRRSNKQQEIQFSGCIGREDVRSKIL